MSRRYAKFVPEPVEPEPEATPTTPKIKQRAIPIEGKIPCWYSTLPVPTGQKKTKKS